MSKTEMTWLGLIKLKLAELKKEGKSPSIGDVTPVARKEWAQIKAGTHPKYIQGKAQTFARKSKKNKTMKKDHTASSSSASMKTDLEDILNDADVKICAKCKKNIQKALEKKSMNGGGKSKKNKSKKNKSKKSNNDEEDGSSAIPTDDAAAAPADGGSKCKCSKKKKMNGGCVTCSL